MSASKTERIPWWLWPNVLSLDAPVVALVWLRAYSQAFEVSVSPWIYGILFLAVWCIYSGDRLVDILRERQTRTAETFRHRFVDRNRTLIATILVLAATLTAAIAFSWLPPVVFRTGAGLAFFVAAYFALFVWRRLPGKEIVAGFIFAFGVAMPVLVEFESIPAGARLFPILFGLICGFNCLLIEQRESAGPKSRGPALIGASLVVLTIVAAWILTESREIQLSLFLAALALTGLEITRDRWPKDLFRVLADVALLTPILFPLFY